MLFAARVSACVSTNAKRGCTTDLDASTNERPPRPVNIVLRSHQKQTAISGIGMGQVTSSSLDENEATATAKSTLSKTKKARYRRNLRKRKVELSLEVINSLIVGKRAFKKQVHTDVTVLQC